MARRPTPRRRCAGNAFDERIALERTGGDRELLQELIAVFLNEIPNWMQALRGALERRDAAALRITAHAVKGAVDSCGASGAFDAAMLLERIGAEGNLACAPAALAVLERRIERARVELGAYLARDARAWRRGGRRGDAGRRAGGERAGLMAVVLVVDDSPVDRTRAGGLLKKRPDLTPAFASTGARRWRRSPSARRIWC